MKLRFHDRANSQPDYRVPVGGQNQGGWGIRLDLLALFIPFFYQHIKNFLYYQCKVTRLVAKRPSKMRSKAFLG